MEAEKEPLTHEEFKEKVADLNRKKQLLQKKQNLSATPEEYAEEWRELAEEYVQIDARANASFCMDRYRHFTGVKVEPEPTIPFPVSFDETPAMPEPVLPTEIFNWQRRADMK